MSLAIQQMFMAWLLCILLFNQKKQRKIIFPSAYLERYLPGQCLLDAVKAALRVVFTHIWQIEVKGMHTIGGIIFGNFDKLKGERYFKL